MARSSSFARIAVSGLGLCGALLCTGCQVDIGGQTLPSPYYLSDDVQYFPTGPKFKLAQEGAAQKAYSESLNEQRLAPPR